MRCLYNGPHPCGKCPACLANRQRAFCFRLDQERDACSFYYWLTLTYDDDHIPRFNGSDEYCFDKQHCRSFFEKIRKRYSVRGFTFKHFLVSEYGPNATHRPHYHCLLLVYSDHSLAQLYNERKEMREFILSKAWVYGHVTEKSFHGRVLSYLTKYCTKPELLNEYHSMKPFTLISSGIGLSFLSSIPQKQIDYMISNLDFSVRYGKSKIQLPRYYVDKILPHSQQNLRDLIPEDPVNGDWKPYQDMQDLRDRLQNQTVTLGKQRMNYLYSKYDDLEVTNQLEINRLSRFEEFRSQLSNRKDL